MISILCIYLLVFHLSWFTGLIVFGLFIMDHTLLVSVRQAWKLSREERRLRNKPLATPPTLNPTSI